LIYWVLNFHHLYIFFPELFSHWIFHSHCYLI
jgi:hypothetical protein